MKIKLREEKILKSKVSLPLPQKIPTKLEALKT